MLREKQFIILSDNVKFTLTLDFQKGTQLLCVFSLRASVSLSLSLSLSLSRARARSPSWPSGPDLFIRVLLLFFAWLKARNTLFAINPLV